MKYCNLTIFSGIINSLVENYNISLTWIKMNLAATPGDDFPYHYSRARENSEVVIIYPEYPRIMDMSDMGVNHGQSQRERVHRIFETHLCIRRMEWLQRMPAWDQIVT